jgi:uncharacterized protein
MYAAALARAREPRRFIQVLAGPRQVGKTTLARQMLDEAGLRSHFASADDPAGQDRAWIAQQWELGRLRAGEDRRRGAILVLDEVQKVPGWADVVKLHWDEDTASRTRLRVFLLGSAPLLVQQGLGESLAGRFELIRVPHWSFAEMRDAFDWDLDRFLFNGGYPGAAPLAADEPRWRSYIVDSLIETTISRDVFLMTRVDKPALLRQLFRLACDYSGQVLSYTKMLGQLQDAGNTTTLAHYLELLRGAGLVAGLAKFSGSRVRQRGSSPKLMVLNTALMSATSGLSYREAREDPDFWGRLVESAVGAHLASGEQELFYWRERNREVDFVVRRGRKLTAIEVTSGARKGALPGITEFAKNHNPDSSLLVGGQGLPIDEFLLEPAERWVR